MSREIWLKMSEFFHSHCRLRVDYFLGTNQNKRNVSKLEIGSTSSPLLVGVSSLESCLSSQSTKT